MTIKKITANLATGDVAGLSRFYSALFDLQTAMDLGWIATLTAERSAPVHLSIASEGGSGAPVPDLSIEVEDVDAVYARAKDMDAPIAYPLTDEPWGIRRFYVADPAGRLLNITMHL